MLALYSSFIFIYFYKLANVIVKKVEALLKILSNVAPCSNTHEVKH